jgi:hypothetical protein
MIFLSKDGQDEYVNMLAAAHRTLPISTKDFVYSDSTEPIVLRGIMKYKVMEQCWNDSRDFYYIDTGYFGNERNAENPNGWKYWHRIVKNNLQHTEIIARPDDRFRKFNKTFSPWKKKGTSILVAAPDEKPCKFYGIDKDTWVRETVETIQKYTDRPVIVRDRVKDKIERRVSNTLIQALDNDVFALVTYNSIAAVVRIFHGIPAFTLAPANAASPVALQELSKIETPYYPDNDTLYAWGCHLAYGQFHVAELKNGSAMDILNV